MGSRSGSAATGGAAAFCTQCGAKIKPGARFCTSCGAPVRSARSSKSRKRSSQRSRARRVQRRWYMTPRTWAWVGGVVVVLVVALVFFSLNRSAPTSSDLPDYHDESGIPYPDVPRISLAEAKARYDAGAALFVDVRSQEEYRTAHIPGAVSLPLTELDERYQELPRDAEIITYCT
ncbi:MAG: zinc-ribbon domain-containing protein [Chloroflexi bacterium]|nr:zinc-ribbon domain-containing protein [Chloroflexota bacterium]